MWWFFVIYSSYLEWVNKFLGGVAITVNDMTCDVTSRQRSQGDLLSPMLYNIIMDRPTILIELAKMDGQINTFVPYHVDDGLSIYNTQ